MELNNRYTAQSLHQKLLVFILLSGFAFTSTAQIVNIEKSRLDKKEGWIGNIDFNLNFTKNTRQIWQLNNRTGAQYNKGKHVLLFLADMGMIQSDNEQLLSRGFEHVRYNYLMGKKQKFALEAFEQVQYNKIQKIKLRVLVGGGARYSFIKSDTNNLFIGTTPMYEYEELIDNATIERRVRLSNYFSFGFRLWKKVTVSSITYYQPDVVNFSDYRLSNESSLSIGVTDRLSFKVLYNLLYDSKPPIEVPNIIYSLSNGIGWKF